MSLVMSISWHSTQYSSMRGYLHLGKLFVGYKQCFNTFIIKLVFVTIKLVVIAVIVSHVSY